MIESLRRLSRCAALYAILMLAATTAQAQTATYQFDLPAQALADSLRAVGRQTGKNILFDPALVEGVSAPALRAQLTMSEAIGHLLAGTTLNIQNTASDTVLVQSGTRDASNAPKKPVPSKTTAAQGLTGYMQLAQAKSTEAPVSATDETAPEQNDPLSSADDSENTVQKLDEVVVTGSRLRLQAGEGAQPVNVYTREDIDRTGQTTIAGFLNTLPEVTTAFTEASLQNRGGALGYSGSTTVTLRGLPAGTTSTLLNGRRLPTSGTTLSTFDLNLIPLAAIERIEIVPQGSSAIYGSDALAGVVNFVLKKDFSGAQLDASFGGASGTDESSASLALGSVWPQGSLSFIGTYYTRSELSGTERDITANRDFTRFGGPDARDTQCNPGNVYSTDGSDLPGLSSPQAAIPMGLSGTPAVQDFVATAGQLNKCSSNAFIDQIPATDRFGGVLTGSYALTDSLELFSELLYSRVRQDAYRGSNPIFSFFNGTLGASNPFNSFGEDVSIDYRFDDDSRARLGYLDHSDFMQAVVGLKGLVGPSWDWELAAWQSREKGEVAAVNETWNLPAMAAALASSDPATAFNPFVAGLPVSGNPSALFPVQARLQSFCVGSGFGQNGEYQRRDRLRMDRSMGSDGRSDRAACRTERSPDSLCNAAGRKRTPHRSRSFEFSTPLGRAAHRGLPGTDSDRSRSAPTRRR